MRYTRRHCSDDEIAIAPNRLCCALILQEALIRQERQYIKDVLHGRLPRPGCPRVTSPKDISPSTEVHKTNSAPASLKQARNNQNVPVGAFSPTSNVLGKPRVSASRQLAMRLNSSGEETPDEHDEDELLHKDGETDDDWLDCYKTTTPSWRSGPVFPQQQFDIY